MSHLELSGSTGNPVIGVFQTLSAGNAGHVVPGMSRPPTPAGAVVVVVGTAAWLVDVVADGNVVVVVVVVVAFVVVVTAGRRVRPSEVVVRSGAVDAGAVAEVADVARGAESCSEADDALHPDTTTSTASAARTRTRSTG